MRRLYSPLLKLLAALATLGLLLVIYLDSRVTATFNDKMWELPARVYARPLELFVGARLAPEDLNYELELLGYRKVSRVRGPGQYQVAANRFDVFTRGFDFPSEREPSRKVQIELASSRVSALQSGSESVDLMRLDPVQIGGIYPSHGEDRLLVQLHEVPETLRLGLLAIEDQSFYSHWGFSFTGIARAIWANISSGALVAGGSTITQQLVKNYYLTPERSLRRKLTELVMAVLLELHYSKEQILESYFNEVYLGQAGPRAIHGFALASRYYFDTPIDQLGLHQQALLIGMVKGASLYNPLRNPERAKERRNIVLNAMAKEGVISAEHAAVASNMPLDLNRNQGLKNSFPAYLDLVRRQLRQEYREEDLTSLGLTIFTAFDPIVQRQAERSTKAVMAALDSSGELETATIVTRFDTGEVAALVGGRQVRYAGFNRALDARRPAGSLLKPAVYLAALEQPDRYTLASIIRDEPVTVEGADDNVWRPRNFDRTSHGPVPLHRALANSYNLATAQLGLELGIDSVADMIERLGVKRSVPRVPALTLGAGEYAPIDMAAMYQTIAAGGFRMPLRSIRDIVDAHGEPLRRYPLEYDRTVSIESVHLLHYALREVVREGTGRGVYRYLGPEFEVAGKTGTTNQGRDSWFAGFSGDLLAVSWIGRDDNAETRLTGSSGALRLWAHFMSRASNRSLGYRMPENMSTHWVDESDGRLTGQGCPNARMLPFINGSQPTASTQCAPRKSGIKDWFQSLFGRG